jgi:hypothetical protein
MEIQQDHLKQLIEQRTELGEQLQKLNESSSETKNLFLKVQGAIEYLEGVGTKLPEAVVEEAPEVSETEVVESPAE